MEVIPLYQEKHGDTFDSCCQVVFEASGVDEAADGVAGEVAQIPGRCRVGAPGVR